MSAPAAAQHDSASDQPRAKRRPRVAVNCLDFGLGEACEYPPARARPVVTTEHSGTQQPQQEQASFLPPPPPLPPSLSASQHHKSHPPSYQQWDKPAIPRDQHVYGQMQLPTPPDINAAVGRPSIGTRVAALETVLHNEPTSAPSPKAAEVNQIVAGFSPAALPSSSSDRHKTPYSPAPSSSSTSRSPQHGVALKSVRDIISDLRMATSREPPPSCRMASMNQMIDAVKQARSFDITTYSRHKWEHLSLPPLRGAPSPPSDESTAWPPLELANQLLQAYIDHVSPLHPFLHTPFLRLLHKQRSQLSDVFLTSALHLVYAIGSTYLKQTGSIHVRGFDAEQHIDAALQHLDDVLLPQNIRSVQFLLFLTIYSLRRHQVTNAWTYADLAMRRCEELGLHRRADHLLEKTTSPLNLEMRKRVFWTGYSLDRQISGVLGRSPAISDGVIDIELPLDIEETVEDNVTIEAAQREAAVAVPDMMNTKPTSLTNFNHICRLRIMESQIRGSMAQEVSMPWT
ncbi:fungal-specific transcription factor domain-domain-containing protein [Microdochium bolleyi]|uniref:Fungal-specific transcription factor domain-domain-containing protein n=1 Tax=Microdochium bolleyi TaxID=196109 RepID=A0A136JD07_9PEZI|nr:fungal-specific transcription factor domain-domain-containing protein [Microdochium bolleyi]